MIELMVTVGLVGILLAIAVPSFRQAMVNTETAEVSNDFVSAMNLARSEAGARGVTIAVAASSSGNWEDGWQVIAPAVAGSASAVPEVLRSYAALAPAFTVSTTGNTARIEFNARGTVVGAAGDTDIQICRELDSEAKRVIVTVHGSGTLSSHRDDSASGPNC